MIPNHSTNEPEQFMADHGQGFLRTHSTTEPTNRRVVVGVDLGGTGTRFIVRQGATGLAGTIMRTEDLDAPTPALKAQRFAAVITDLIPEGLELGAVGIGASGPIDRDWRVIENRYTLPWFSGFDLVGELEREFGVKVALESDAVSAALGECAFGAGRRSSRLLAVTVGTGIGVCLVDQGRPFRGVGGTHPEAGHFSVNDDPRRCYCGLYGCWETTASRLGLEERLRAAGHSPLPPGPSADFAPGSAVAAILHEHGRTLGRGLETLNTLYEPDRIVICGAISQYFAWLKPGVLSEMRRAPGFDKSVDLVQSELGDHAGAIGASTLVEPRLPAWPAWHDEQFRWATPLR